LMGTILQASDETITSESGHTTPDAGLQYPSDGRRLDGVACAADSAH
jgi:hypothetical protein